MVSYSRIVAGVDAMSSRLSRPAALIDALLRIVADRGLDQVSVREVAAAADVSIGTVQYWFPSKDAILAAAFDEVARRIRARLAAASLGGDPRQNLSVVLRELLPLDDRRRAEVRIVVAFAARAAISPVLADIQRSVLTELHQGLTEAFMHAWGGRATRTRCELAAHVAAAAADGLALHAVSTVGWLSEQRLADALDLALDLLTGEGVGTDAAN
jgi:AcrR family transcriptional regulator